MNIAKNIVKKTEEILFKAGIEEYKKEASIIIEELSGRTKAELIASCYQNLDEEKILNVAKKRANSKMPLQYILGYSYFMGQKLKVDENVLIPRDETEILVLKAYELLKNKEGKIHILDIGLGSGAISIALAKKLEDKEIEILGVDISLGALEIALDNISNLNLVRKIIVRKSDLFSKVRDIEKFDLIISNPPYIPQKEKTSLQKEVLFEPEVALFAPDEKGEEFYQKIIETAPKFLKKDGYLAFELGIFQSEDVSKMLEKDFSNIEITKDLAKIDRVITAKIK